MQSSSRSRRSQHTRPLIWTIIFVLAAFYTGVLVGMQHGKSREKINAIVEERVKTATQTMLKRQEIANKRDGNLKKGQTRFPLEMSRFAFGAARTTRKEFLETFDGGLPDAIKYDSVSSEVLIIYNNKKSVPTVQRDQTIFDDGDGLPKLSVGDATQNCQSLHVISTKATWDAPQCLAIVGQYSSFHIHQWMRIDGGKADMSLPLKPVGRGQLPQGKNEFTVPHLVAMRKGWNFLASYMTNYAQVNKELAPILRKVVNAENTIIVMVANLGHADLLANFVCNSKANNLDINHILVFVTDKESYNIATGLGLVAYHDTLNFAKISMDEAKIYGDKTFREIMFVKAAAVQLVNSQGYNVLFQDLDVVWYQNPLPLFEDKQSELAGFDIIFQDDGARNNRFAPYSGNTGFYFVRYNQKTRYLLTSFLYNSDLIASTGSHQQALMQLLSEHSSLYGLRVKTISGHLLPGGYHYHRDKQAMKDIIAGTLRPYIFHMSWTHNKKNKVLFMQQMGMWFVQEQCEGEGLGDLPGSSIIQECCANEPRVVCHFSDKPSIVNCKKSPVLDRGSRPFW